MDKEKEYWQCTHIRKCKWVGENKDLDKVKQHSDINMINSVCPKCGNDEFYILTEEQYQKLIKRLKGV